MIPLLPLALSGAGLAAGATIVKKIKQSKTDRQRLIHQLTRVKPASQPASATPTGSVAMPEGVTTLVTEIQTAVTDLVQQIELETKGQALTGALGAGLVQLDNHYQQWVHDHVDPIFGSKRHQQMRTLSGGRGEDLSPVQKQANYLLLWAGAGLGLATTAVLAGIPIALVSIPFGLIVMIPSIKLAYQKAVIEHKFSIVHLGVLYLAGLYLGGYLFIGAAGLFLLAFSYKIGALNEAIMRDGLVNIFGEQPRYGWKVVDGVETEVPIAQVMVDDILVFDVGQVIPIDGSIVNGIASIDQHMLTGEAQPAEKGVGDPVLAATIVLSGRIHVRVEKTGTETTAAQIGEILNQTAIYRPSIEEKALLLADRSLTPMLIGSGLGLLVAGPVGALAMMGCNFTLNMVGLIPLTMLNVLNQSSHLGILVKEGDALEKLHTVDTFVFDKTGTLTVAQPHVVHIHICGTHCEEDVLRLAAAAEHRQTHPVAQAILAAAAERQLTFPTIEDAHYEVGYGIKVRVGETSDGQQSEDGSALSTLPAHPHFVCVGSWRFMEMEQIEIPPAMQSLIESSQELGHSLVFVALNEALIGVLELHATVRDEALQVVKALQQRGMKTYIISGDQEASTRTLANALGVDGYFANTLPEHKAELIMQLKEEGHKVCFIGDGINDAIALKKADVSISLCGATTAATDTAQVVLMDADLSQLLTLIALVEEMHKNLSLNFNVSIGLTLLAAGGILFFQAGFVIVEALYALSIATGVGIASMPMLKQHSNMRIPSRLADSKN